MLPAVTHISRLIVLTAIPWGWEKLGKLKTAEGPVLRNVGSVAENDQAVISGIANVEAAGIIRGKVARGVQAGQGIGSPTRHKVRLPNHGECGLSVAKRLPERQNAVERQIGNRHLPVREKSQPIRGFHVLL